MTHERRPIQPLAESRTLVTILRSDFDALTETVAATAFPSPLTAAATPALCIMIQKAQLWLTYSYAGTDQAGRTMTEERTPIDDELAGMIWWNTLAGAE